MSIFPNLKKFGYPCDIYMKPEEEAKIFFEERFGNKKSKTDGHFQEWVEHFKTGHPETFMDGWSKAIYMRLIREKKFK